jgi:hypothetical protein
MKLRSYRVETQASNSTAWEIVYYTDSLPVAKVHAARLWKTENVRAVRVVDQRTERVVGRNSA